MPSVYLYTPITPLSQCPTFWPVFEAAVTYSAMSTIIICRTSAEVGMVMALLAPIVKSGFPRIETLQSFWSTMMADATAISDAFRPIYLRRAVASYPVESSDWFSDIYRLSGFCQQLDRFLSVIDRHGFNEDVYVHRHPSGQAVAKSTLTLLRHVDMALPQNHPFNGKATSFLAGKTVVTFGFLRPSPEEKKQLSTLFELVLSAMVVMPYRVENRCFQAGREGVEWVEHLPFFGRKIECVDSVSAQSPQILEYETAEDELDAVVHFCRDILQRYGESGLNQICVVDCGHQASRIENRLVSDGIRVNRQVARKVSDTLVGEFLMMLVSMSVGTFDRHRLLALLSIPIWKFSDGFSALRPFFSSLANQFNIQPGIDQWRFALDAYMNSLHLQPDLEYQTSAIDSATLANRFFDRLSKVIASVQSAQSGPEIVSAVLPVIDEWFGHHFMAVPDTDIGRQVVTEFADTLDFFEQFCSHFDAAFDLGFFYSVMLDGFNKPMQSYVEGARSGVRVMPMSQLPLCQWQWVWIMGASDGALPHRIVPTIFCPHSLYPALQWPTLQSEEDLALMGLASWIMASQSRVTISYALKYGSKDAFRSDVVDKVCDYFTWPVLPQNVISVMPTLSPKQETTLPMLMPMAFEAKAMSVTSLETYQSCPFRYYLKYCLKVSPIESVSEDIQASIWGQLIHEIFEMYYTSIRPLGYSEYAGHNRELLFEVAREAFEAVSQPTFYWDLKRDLLFGNDVQLGLLDAFLANEDRQSIGLFPVKMEYAFSNVDMHLNDDAVLKLSGKIDAVLSDTARRAVAVLDYKTGKTVPAAVDVKEFRTLQLPIYMWIIEKQMPTTTCVAGLIYHVRHPKELSRHVVAVSESGRDFFDLGRKRPFKLEDGYGPKLVDTLTRIYALMRSGYFSPQLHSDLDHVNKNRSSVCQYCDYVLVCQYSKRFGDLS